MTKIISISNQKGGVGKTTLTTNISYSLSLLGYKVLVLDLDPQCDLTFQFGIDNDDVYNIERVLSGKVKIDEALYEVNDNLDVLPGHRDTMFFKSFGSSDLLKKKLKELEEDEYDFILIDLSPTFSDLNVQGYVASDYIMIVTDAETFSLKNLNVFINDLEAIKHRLNKDMHILGVVVNRVDMRRNLTIRKIAELREAMGEYVFEEYINTDTAFPIASHQRIAVRQTKNASRAKAQIARVSLEMLKRIGVE